MNTLAVLTAIAGFTIVLASIILYFRTIPRGTVPKKIGGFATKLAVGVALSIVGVYLGITGTGSSGLLVYIPAGLGIMFGSFILWVLTQRKTPLGDVKVKVGDKILPFTAQNSQGTPFDSGELGGKRILLKFFRGGWCPYCSAELSAFNDMAPELEKFNVGIVALSKDTPTEATVHKLRDGLNFPLLADPDLKVIRQYGLEHHKALGQTKNPKKNIDGIPFGLAPFSFSAMAIPTSLLIDEHGVIRWVDQTDDYRLRSSTKRVMEAVKAAFG
jgi:peroxiredoxin